MELMLISLAIAYMFTSKHSKDTAQAAYKAGKEPPGLAKARMRHESGGSKKPGGQRKPNGKPTGHGAMRLMVSQRWANACEKVKDKSDDKHRRWRAWYAEQSPERDAAWREKQATRIAKSEARADKFARARGIARDAVTPGARKERQAWDENTARDEETDQATTEADSLSVTDVPGEGDNDDAIAVTPDAAGHMSGDHNDPSTWCGTDRYGRDIQTGRGERREVTSSDGTVGVIHDDDTYLTGGDVSPERRVVQQHATAHDSTTTGAATSGATSTGIGDIVDYSSAAQALRTAAERVDQYRADLSAMADGLGGKQWGVEVHGPIRDMDEALATTAGNYRDLAAQMEIQGDSVRDAEDAHPYVPGAEVVNA